MAEPFVILVVDDHPANRFTLRTLLARLPDCRVVEAGSGEEALLRAMDEEVHLILLDVQMPGMDGFETARHLGMTGRTRHIPVVFVTAVFKAEEFVRQGYGIGAVDYLTKPIDDNLLLNRVRLYQRIHQRERQLRASVEQLQRHQRELVAARDQAEAANRAKSVFLANMSHELRTPLNAILGFAQIMAREADISETHQRELGTILRSGQHLLALINDVLEIARIEAERVTVHNEPFDLGGLVTGVEEMLRVRAEAKGLALEVERDPGLPPHVLGDAHHLRQVLINLLGNAVKYTDRGQAVLRITPTDGLIHFEVTDTGPGIPRADQGRIFDAFYQTEVGIAKGEGTGLGLTLCREFVRLMGGELRVESNPPPDGPGGTSFRFAIPLPPAAAPVASHPGRVLRLEHCPDAVSPDGGKAECRVLVAEDHPDNRELIQRLLEKIGFTVRLAENGQQAVEAFADWRPCLILMDMRMPVLDGYEATRRIRALPGGDAVRIIAFTASVLEEEHPAIQAAGCDAIARKPIEEELLFETMGRLLGLRFSYAQKLSESQLSPLADLSALTETQRNALIAAAEQLDEGACMTVIEGLRPEFPAEADHLSELVRGYRFDRVLALCEMQKTGD